MYDSLVNPGGPKPLDELKLLDRQIDQAVDLGGLRPIYYKVDEIGRKHPDNVDVQLAVGDIKQRIMQRGSVLTAQEAGLVAPSTRPIPPAAPPDTTPTEPRGDLPTAMYGVNPAARTPDAAPPMPPPPKRGSRLGVVIGVIVAVAVIGAAAYLGRDRIARLLAPSVVLQVATVPSGASVRVNGAARCTSECTLSLPPGAYQIAAVLDGYMPAADGVTLTVGQPASLHLTLTPQPQSVRVITDLVRGKVVLDGRPAADLQQGRYLLENVEPGRHKITVTGPSGEASFGFDLAQAKAPEVMGTVVTRNLEAVLVSSFARQARVLTSSGPWKFAVNGRPVGDAGPAGVELPSFEPGQEELVIEQGPDRRAMSETYGTEPTLTAFLRTDPKGLLTVAAGEDGVRVFLNDREYPLRTRKGELLIPWLGPVTVRVMKSGFENPPPQSTEVKKAAGVRLEFQLTPPKP